MYVLLSTVLSLHGKELRVTGGIKSLVPSCVEDALPFGDHLYTCSNCANQMRELKDTLRQRKYGSCNTLENRVGHVGFNKRYAQKEEVTEALNNKVDRRKDATKQVSVLVQVILLPREWEIQLQESCINGEDQKLIIDLKRLFKSGVSKTQSVQVLVIKNFFSKLLKGNNHHN